MTNAKHYTLFSTLLILALAGSCRDATASTIITSTIPAFPTCCGEAIGNPPNASLQTAIRFTPDLDYLLESVTFDLGTSFGTGFIVAQIYSEEGGLPGEVLTSITAPTLAPASGGLFTITPVTPFVLRGATAYWLTGVNTDPNSGSYWWYSDQIGWRAVRNLPGHPAPGFPNWGNANGGGPGGPGTPQISVLSFEITGTAVPEPSLSLMVGFVAGLILCTAKWRKRTGF